MNVLIIKSGQSALSVCKDVKTNFMHMTLAWISNVPAYIEGQVKEEAYGASQVDEMLQWDKAHFLSEFFHL